MMGLIGMMAGADNTANQASLAMKEDDIADKMEMELEEDIHERSDRHKKDILLTTMQKCEAGF